MSSIKYNIPFSFGLIYRDFDKSEDHFQDRETTVEMFL